MVGREALSRSFGAAAEAYESGRPDYPRAAVEWMLGPVRTQQGPLRAADIGAGTGKLTRVLVGLGADVIAIDPDADMLAALRRTVPEATTLVGAAEQIPLPDASLDAVVLGQAWHWVRPDAGSAEIGRVLRSGGVLGLIWNIRDSSVPWVARLTSIMRGSHAETMLSAGDPPLCAPFDGLEERRWSWSRPMTRETLTAMVHSRSYVITAAAGERERIDRAAAALFDQIGAVGAVEVELPYLTRAFRAVLPASPVDVD